ncbi:putative inactive receptor kinase [Camellia lanceoleosa]|nr:putative inactive receptor kinase [Camellia lanceoleosa]
MHSQSSAFDPTTSMGIFHLMLFPSFLHYLYLQQNSFSGDILPLSPQLNFLDLSFNSFMGSIPNSIQNLTFLTGLNLQNNSLTGTIPNLNLPNLKHFNLSNNHLNGSIPSSLKKFPASSFKGNSLLCGSPLNQCPMSPSPAPSRSFFPPSLSPTYLPPSLAPAYLPPSLTLPQKQKTKTKLTTGAIIAIATGGFAVLFLPLLIMALMLLEEKDGGSGRAESLRASAEVTGKELWTTYKAILEEGTTVVVKRLKEVVVGKREFEQQMEMVGRVVGQHPNVMTLRAYYYSKDEKLLVYDNMPLGSLSDNCMVYTTTFFSCFSHF